ncbi:MAG: DUF4364 family protein [Lachnospiraceae bacterium]|nr:DUF4364 family protein [Lachnospiraceae bacterium]
MISDPQVLYKLMVLYLLQQANLPISNEQISEFFLTTEYTNYMTLQQGVSELLDAHLIKVTTVRGSQRYEITREGEETLSFFGSDIPDAIKEDIHAFLKKHKIRLRNEMGITADYRKTAGTDYEVTCEVREGKVQLLKLLLSVPSEEQARIICDRWQSSSQEIYSHIMHTLLQDE